MFDIGPANVVLNSVLGEFVGQVHRGGQLARQQPTVSINSLPTVTDASEGRNGDTFGRPFRLDREVPQFLRRSDDSFPCFHRQKSYGRDYQAQAQFSC